MGKELSKFKKLLTDRITSKIPIQTEWAKVSSVDLENKTMVAIGELNNLEYHDCLLGLGSIITVPKIDSLVLIGSIHNGEACFLISAEEIDTIQLTDSTGFKVSLNAGEMKINGEAFGGIVNAVELKEQLDKVKAIVAGIQNAFSNWAVVGGDGGAGLKALSNSFTNLENGDFSNIENPTIKHGDGE